MAKQKVKEQGTIPVGKVQRAAKFARAGMRVGGNYIKHYGQRAVGVKKDKGELDTENAEVLYESLSELKGSALKVAQMLSMDSQMLPTAYLEKFAEAQYNAPPLSYPLVVKTFKSQFKKSPEEVFESFTRNAVNAASIGQVHKAELDGKELAVKIQYPGVAESVKSDLKMVKPFALRLMNMREKDVEPYMNEVQERLLEETDYELEVRRSIKISQAAKDLDNVVFPDYYPELSGSRIITMDWLAGKPIKEFIAQKPSQEVRNKVGQTLWDFTDFQIHRLKMLHADPHPGNFLIQEDGTVGVIDFGCVKEVPEDFYQNYFAIVRGDIINDTEALDKALWELEFYKADDDDEKRVFYRELLVQSIRLVTRPFRTERFDFGDPSFFEELHAYGEKMHKDKTLRNSDAARGSAHGIYINRTYFGLYNILHQLGATVDTGLKV